MKSRMHAAILATIIIIVVVLAMAFALKGIALYIPPRNVRTLAEIFLNTTFNQWVNISAMAPEAVTAIVWDYRGLDTLFETSVMFIAILGALTLSRGVGEKLFTNGASEAGGLSVIVKTITRIILVMTSAVGASIALHGHLTPGGGFQGGATLAVAPMILIVTFSVYFLTKRITINKAVILRTAGLSVIALASFIVLIVALLQGSVAYIFQNQVKMFSPYSIPSYMGDSLVLGGTLLLFNASETFAVFFGFIVLLILITLPEDQFRKVVLESEE
ncbi:MnhB domain-containing protein [Ignisphaera sp. 4213-co]|uniref:MnhB domain-containing protein n=1 Tax=Ignisphaera cupida TaxID=3050454 RepID=A0ABD4Z5W1_9CREN|nr:MnhB domain-containing protein [Ignisphaera sp. 4213-co]MDK6028509.1 MnhB domain-containing protein [Ignisphaera sp. 4213-co]